LRHSVDSKQTRENIPKIYKEITRESAQEKIITGSMSIPWHMINNKTTLTVRA